MVDSFVLPKEYGYVILVASTSALVATWHGTNVGKYRSAAKVPYPNAYASHDEASQDAKKKQFNCAQRAHHNFLETYPVFLALLAMGGIRYPTISAVGGLIWLAGRVVYTLGYSTGNPSLRSRGSFNYIGLITLLGTAVTTGVQLIRGA